MEAKEDLASGLYGTLLVLEPGMDHDPEADHVFLISQSGPGSSRGAERPPFVNGSLAPDTIGLKSGATYRFRLIGISADDLYFVRLLNGTELLQWRPIARHGADLSPSQRAEVPAREQVAPGTTYDFEFSPSMRADLVLEVDVVHVNSGTPARTPTVVPIRVR